MASGVLLLMTVTGRFEGDSVRFFFNVLKRLVKKDDERQYLNKTLDLSSGTIDTYMLLVLMKKGKRG